MDRKLLDFYRSQKFVDCTFKINDSEIRAHKLILATSSPVFEKMFFGDMASSLVVLCDVKLDEFKEVLEYIYSQKINITSVVHAWSLFYIANKYMLEDLVHVCLSYIIENVSMSTLVLSYEYAEMFNVPNVKEKCFRDIIDYIYGVFTCDYHMKPSTLRSILRNAFNMDNLDLTIKILEWASNECDFKELLVTPVNVVEILKEEHILNYISKDWLLSLKCDNCNESLIFCQCVSEVIHKTLLYLDDVMECCENQVDNFTYQKLIPTTCKFRKMFKIACRLDLLKSEEYVSSISVNKPIMLLGILLNTDMNISSVCQVYYEGAITVRVCEQNQNTNLAKPTIAKNIFYYDSYCFLPLKDVVTLETNKIYDVRISYKNFSNKGVESSSIVCYYMSNQLLDKSSNSVISFYDMCGTVIRGLTFYPA